MGLPKVSPIDIIAVSLERISSLQKWQVCLGRALVIVGSQSANWYVRSTKDVVRV